MISIYDDVLDSCDIQERIDYLEIDTDAEEQEELETWLAFKNQADSSEWSFGIQFIREDYFTDYAQELAGETGAVDGGEQWPLNCINWDQAARDLSFDYSSIEVDGTEYYYRDC